MVANQHYIDLYHLMFLQIRRSVIRGGTVVNAKPIFLLALIECIRRRVVENNVFCYGKPLNTIYYEIWSRFYPNILPTPICKPYFYLMHDGFWNIEWNNIKVLSSPTDKRMRENVKHGYLDNALYDLFQEENIRRDFENLIISHFIVDTKTK